MLSETGGPGAVAGGLIAAQGLGIAGGLAGGVWLIPLTGGEPRQVAPSGDSPRLSGQHVVWQELDEGALKVRIRQVQGGDSRILASNAAHPAFEGPLVVWTDWTGGSRVWVLDVESGDRIQLAEAGVFPDVRGGLVTFLRPRGDRYDVCVSDVRRRQIVFTVEDVGFPTGRGPILTDREVVWESGRGSAINQLRFATLPTRAD